MTPSKFIFWTNLKKLMIHIEVIIRSTLFMVIYFQCVLTYIRFRNLAIKVYDSRTMIWRFDDFGILYGPADRKSNIHSVNAVGSGLGYWEVLVRKKYTDNSAFSFWIIIGIFSPCQDFLFFDSWFSLNITLSISHSPLRWPPDQGSSQKRNPKNMLSLLTMIHRKISLIEYSFETLGKLASFAVSFVLVTGAGFSVFVIFTITITRVEFSCIGT